MNGDVEESPKGDADGLPNGVVETSPNGDADGLPNGVVETSPNVDAGGFPNGVVEAPPNGDVGGVLAEAFPETDGFVSSAANGDACSLSSFVEADRAGLAGVAGVVVGSCENTGFGGSFKTGVSSFAVAHTGLVGVADCDAEPNDAKEFVYAPKPPADGVVGVVGAAAAGVAAAPKLDFPNAGVWPKLDCPNATEGFAPNPLCPNADEGAAFGGSDGVVVFAFSSFF